jgi:hypothetical protein
MLDLDTTRMTPREIELYSFLSARIHALQQCVAELEETNRKRLSEILELCKDKERREASANRDYGRVVRKRIEDEHDYDWRIS